VIPSVALVSQAGPLAMRQVLAADATYLKRSLMFVVIPSENDEGTNSDVDSKLQLFSYSTSVHTRTKATLSR
jgi:hypothetical protein